MNLYNIIQERGIKTLGNEVIGKFWQFQCSQQT